MDELVRRLAQRGIEVTVAGEVLDKLAAAGLEAKGTVVTINVK